MSGSGDVSLECLSGQPVVPIQPQWQLLLRTTPPIQYGSESKQYDRLTHGIYSSLHHRMSAPNKYNLYIMSRQNSSGDEQWGLATAPPNDDHCTFYYSDLNMTDTYSNYTRPPHVLENQLLNDDKVVYKKLLSTITLPHMYGRTGFIAIAVGTRGCDSIAYVTRALFELEQAWLVPPETWAEWKDKLTVTPPRAAVRKPSSPTVSSGSSHGGSSTARSTYHRTRGGSHAAAASRHDRS